MKLKPYVPEYKYKVLVLTQNVFNLKWKNTFFHWKGLDINFKKLGL